MNFILLHLNYHLYYIFETKILPHTMSKKCKSSQFCMQSPKVFEIFSLLLTDKIHFWQDVCLKDCDHLHQFNLRYYKPNVCVSVHHLTAII